MNSEPIHPAQFPSTLAEIVNEPLLTEEYGKIYVAGFLFKEGFVALIRKNKPEWQSGMMNGIGGKIEVGETPAAAMTREFLEETGAEIKEWRPFCVLTAADESYTVVFFTAFVDQDVNIESTTDEQVGWYSPHLVEFVAFNAIPNLKWLLPLAQDPSGLESFVIAPA